MSADLLRRAAALIRERASVAPEGPYALGFHDSDAPEYRVLFAGDGDPMGAVRYWPGGLGRDIGEEEQTGAFLTLWHPAVALAVADWLEHEAGMARDVENRTGLLGRRLEYPHEVLEALAVARALLNEETPDE